MPPQSRSPLSALFSTTNLTAFQCCQAQFSCAIVFFRGHVSLPLLLSSFLKFVRLYTCFQVFIYSPHSGIIICSMVLCERDNNLFNRMKMFFYPLASVSRSIRRTNDSLSKLFSNLLKQLFYTLCVTRSS